MKNNPLSFNDPTGLSEGCGILCNIPILPIIIGLDNLFGGSPGFHGSLQPRPTTGDPNWDGNFGESLGISTKVPQTNWGIASALGLPDAGCEFGVCGGIPGSNFGPGVVLAGAGTLVCQIAEPCGVIEDIALASVAVASLATYVWASSRAEEGDKGANPNCAEVKQQAIVECSVLLNTSSYPPGVKRPRRIPTGTDNSGAFFACIREKMEEAGCPNY